MTKIHLLKNYNNYYNRLLKKKSTVNDYITDTDIFIKTIENVNFDVRDGLFTEIIINYTSQLDTPNYAIVETGTYVSDVWISSEFTRWFVIECKQTRGFQYKIALKRDVLAEYFDQIKTSPCIIQKGYVDNSSILAFNKEEQQYNKVKSKEFYIKDNTQMGYVVGFIDRSADYANKIETSFKGSMQVDFDYSALSLQWQNLFAIGSATPVSTMKRILNNSKENVYLKFPIGLRGEDIGPSRRDIYSGSQYVRADGSLSKANWITETGTALGTSGYYYTSYIPNAPATSTPSSDVAAAFVTTRSDLTTGIKYFENQMAQQISSGVQALTISMYNDMLNIDDSQFNAFNYYNGKICQIAGVYYKAEITPYSSSNVSVTNTSYVSTFRQFYPSHTQLQNYDVATAQYIPGQTVNNLSSVNVYATTEEMYIKLTPVENTAYTYLTPSNSRNHLIDAPYDMYVIPYTSDITYTVNGSNYAANEEIAINLAQQIAVNSGSASYDIQIVPYCPFVDTYLNDFSLYSKEPIKDGNDNVIGYYFWAERSSGSFKKSESRSELSLSGSDYSYKELTQLTQYILCSPDKQSQWEFNPAMNKGIHYWNISFDYRPYSSYVKVQPQFDYLYGQATYNNLTDMRGLIFNGSYSITQLNDAWANYVNNNKNYQQIFDTQINTQIKQYDIQNTAAWETMFARSYSLGIINSSLKAYYNGKEQIMNEEIQRVSLESQRKLYKYQLDNIQNVPRTISKLTSINTDFRVWPYVEVFEPSSDDRRHFNDMIRYNGMTIMVTGYIDDYLKANDETFIQATLIRFNDQVRIENDYTLVEDINTELNKGIYITKEV